MSPLSVASTLFNLLQSTSPASQSNTAATASSDFSSSLTLRLAELQAQSITSLLGATSTTGQNTLGLNPLTGANGTTTGSSDPFSLLGQAGSSQGLSASGYQLSLFDPQSAYRMMGVINTRDVNYKAQFAELSEMKTAVSGLQQAAQTLGSISGTLDSAAITTGLQDFADKYNAWSQRFENTVKSDGVLAGTQAAEVSLNELEQSVENRFNGARDGFNGLGDLGLTIDPLTNLASLDTAALDAALAGNKQGAVNTLQEFSVSFAKSAQLLNAPNNFIPNRLDNLDRAIDFISANKSSLQAEFGLGDAARPSDQTARALATYNRIFGS